MAEEIDTFPLIHTKVQQPRLPGYLVRRRSLLDLLHTGVDRKLVVISAQAGSGKTTLLAQGPDECPHPASGPCWTSTTTTWTCS